MSMSSHRRHHSPLFLLCVKTLDGVESLESISPSHHKQQAVDDSDAKLQASTIHVCHLAPTVLPQLVLLYAYCSYTVKHNLTITKIPIINMKN